MVIMHEMLLIPLELIKGTHKLIDIPVKSYIPKVDARIFRT
jgi:hypothetical protein